jgi:hypothetical protein
MPIGRRLICVFKVSLADQDDSAILAGSGYLKQRSECRPGPDGDDAPLLDGAHVDRIEHGQEDAPPLAKVGLLPRAWQVLQELPGGDRPDDPHAGRRALPCITR